MNGSYRNNLCLLESVYDNIQKAQENENNKFTILNSTNKLKKKLSSLKLVASIH